MVNSYGFNDKIPAGTIAALYSIHNGEFTGKFFFSKEEKELAEALYADNENFSVEVIN